MLRSVIVLWTDSILFCKVFTNGSKNATLLANMSSEGMGSSMTVEGSTPMKVLENRTEEAPFGSRVKVEAGDNDGQPFSARKPDRVREVIGCRGASCSTYPPLAAFQSYQRERF